MSPLGGELHGTIARRALVDWLVDPAAVAHLVPEGLGVRTVDGAAVAGMCLIELVDLRPAPLPALVGRRVVAVAHRVSVRDRSGRPGVFVPRRDTPSRLAQLAGGRLWPGVHGAAAVAWVDDGPRLQVEGRVGDDLVQLVAERRRPTSEVPDLAAIHAEEVVAWSPDRRGRLEVACLRCDGFPTAAVRVEAARSSWLERQVGALGPPRALEMRDVAVRWSGHRPSGSAHGRATPVP